MSLSFRSINNDFGQLATAPGQILVSAFSDPTEVGVRKITLPAVPMQSGEGLAAPILINYVVFSSISQSTTAAGAINTLRFRMSTLAGLSGGTRVVLSGLIGSPTASGPISLSGTDASAFASAEWDSVDASIELVWNMNGSEASRDYDILFELENPDEPQDPVPVSIRVLDPKAATRDQEVDIGLGFTGPLHVVGFTQSTIRQSSALPGAINTLTVNLTTTDCIAALSAPLFTISGLRRSATPNTANLAVTVDEYMDQQRQWTVLETGTWDQSRGILTFRFSKNVDSNAWYVLTFKLTNSNKASLPASPMISAAETASLAFANTSLTFSEGFGAPLFVAGRLDSMIADVGQSTPSAATLNTISITLSTSL
eukprot:2107809-Rhodomonas_salina.1